MAEFEKSNEFTEWSVVEVVARTAHGAIELRYSPYQHYFKVVHKLNDGTIVAAEATVADSVFWPLESENPATARRAALLFFERWKKEFALEYLAWSVANG